MIDEFFAYREPAAVGVSFRRSGKVYYFSPNGVRVRQGDQVLAQTDKGIDIGEIVFIKYDLPDTDNKELKPILRKATPEDLAHEQELQLKEREARKVCEQKITEHNLPMRLIAADFTFDGQRLVFFFSAEGRVDFRGLVRDLAEIFHTRIELRQVGVRDQAKMIGGLGPCGRPLCCNAFLRNFDPVGIRVAKDQGLSLNPAKISGICDRLMCCLRYEHDTYLELARKLPRPGQLVNTRKGPAEVRNVILMHERLQVRYPDDTVEDLRASEVWGLDEEAPPLPEVREGEEGERPAEDTTLPLMVRQRPKTARRDKPAAPRGEGSRPGRREAPPAAPGRRPAAPASAPAAAPPAAPAEEAAEGAGKRRRRRRPERKRKAGEGAESAAPAPPTAPRRPAAPGPQERRAPERPETPAPEPTAAAAPPRAEGGPPTDAAAPAGERAGRRRRPRFRSRRKSGPGTPPATGDSPGGGE